MINNKATEPSPCLRCTRVKDPRNCENKRCAPWRSWFVRRWDSMRALPRRTMDTAPMKPVGVSVGGQIYIHPQQRADYLATDPCLKCKCPKDLCVTPCRVKRSWQVAKKEALV